MSSSGSRAEYPGPLTVRCLALIDRTASIAALREPKTIVIVRSSVRRRRPTVSSSNRLWSRTPAATRGCASCIRIAQVPPSVTADSRFTRQMGDFGPNRPWSSIMLPDAIDPSLVTGARADTHYMERALAQARRAAAVGEVPVGAVIVRDGSVLGEAHNMIESTPDATAHAEMLVLRQAAGLARSWRRHGAGPHRPARLRRPRPEEGSRRFGIRRAAPSRKQPPGRDQLWDPGGTGRPPAARLLCRPTRQIPLAATVLRQRALAADPSIGRRCEPANRACYREASGQRAAGCDARPPRSPDRRWRSAIRRVA